MGGITETESWQNLIKHQDTVRNMSIAEAFERDSERAKWFSIEAGSWFFDYSKHLVDRKAIELLLELAREREVESARDALFRGEHVNTTEDRAALHVALRNSADSHETVDGEDVMPQIRHTRARMGAFVEAIHSGSWLGFTGKKIKNVVNIGIGGSDLGPRMAVEALRPYHVSNLKIRFDSNVDSANFYEAVTSDLDPEETLFIIVSKTFTTDETMTNALTARLWIEQAMGKKAVDNHFVAVSSNRTEVHNFGISDTALFEMWDWVGGRFSLPSAAGLSLMLAIGESHFDALLAGYHETDEHFRLAPLEENVPVIMALLSVWYVNFWGVQSELLAPYSQFLQYFPSYVQQLSMESNGKRVTKSGNAIDYATAPVVWGQPGTNSQHSYFQMLHQGTLRVPVDFIGFKEPHFPQGNHHAKLIANMIAQSQALAFGRSKKELEAEGVSQELAVHKQVPGDRPNSVFFAHKLTPKSLGELIALYEHKTFVQGAIWDINSFDQWGVELGKTLEQGVFKDLQNRTTLGLHDDSTANLIDRARQK